LSDFIACGGILGWIEENAAFVSVVVMVGVFDDDDSYRFRRVDMLQVTKQWIRIERSLFRRFS
jgi:hypothetical protein